MDRPELKQAREDIDWSLDQLSEATGISTSQLSRFETGSREPRVKEAVTIAKALKCPVAQIFPELADTAHTAGTVNVEILNDVLDRFLYAIGLDEAAAAELRTLILELAQEPPTSSAGPDYHRVLAEREARRFLKLRPVRRENP